MKTAKSYHFIYDLLEDVAGDLIAGMTEEEKDLIRGADAFEFDRYEIENGVISVYDGWEEDSWMYMTETLEDLLKETVEFVKAGAEK